MSRLNPDRFAWDHQDLGWATRGHWEDHDLDGQEVLCLGKDDNTGSHPSECRHVYIARLGSGQEMGPFRMQDVGCDHQDRHHGQRHRCEQDDHESVDSSETRVCRNKESFPRGHQQQSQSVDCFEQGRVIFQKPRYLQEHRLQVSRHKILDQASDWDSREEHQQALEEHPELSQRQGKGMRVGHQVPGRANAQVRQGEDIPHLETADWLHQPVQSWNQGQQQGTQRHSQWRSQVVNRFHPQGYVPRALWGVELEEIPDCGGP